MNEKCLIKSSEGCILKDETAIVLTIGSLVSIGLFLAGTTLLAPLIGNLEVKK